MEKMNRIMDRYPKMIDHVFLAMIDEWRVRSFLPLCDDHLAYSDDVDDMFCRVCPLAPYAHPMVRSQWDRYSYDKLCTLTVIKTGIVKLKEIFDFPGGCGSFDPQSDYTKAKSLLKKLSMVPLKC